MHRLLQGQLDFAQSFIHLFRRVRGSWISAATLDSCALLKFASFQFVGSDFPASQRAISSSNSSRVALPHFRRRMGLSFLVALPAPRASLLLRHLSGCIHHGKRASPDSGAPFSIRSLRNCRMKVVRGRHPALKTRGAKLVAEVSVVRDEYTTVRGKFLLGSSNTSFVLPIEGDWWGSSRRRKFEFGGAQEYMRAISASGCRSPPSKSRTRMR